MGQTLSFGNFELRLAERQLLHGGVSLPIGSRAYDVLVALIERRDRVVSKNELLDLVWANLAVEENNLTVQISTLRKVLGAGAIATVTGRGYRLTLDVLGGTAAARPGEHRLQRRVATLAAAAVVDWSRLIERDAAWAVAAWRDLRRNVIEQRTPAAGGRLIEITADGLLVEFGSPIDALEWALDLQGGTRGADDGDTRALSLRLAVNTDDVIVDDDRLLGEGVQFTAQMLARTPPGAVAASDVVRALTRGKASLHFVPLPGETAVCADGPLWLVQRERGGGVPAAPRSRGERPATLAVLPFGGEIDDSERYFGDGMTEEIIAALSQNRSLLVIARSSTLRYRGSTQPPAEIATELGVRYLLNGTARRHAGRLRISAELVDAPNNRVIWADRYDGADSELFAFQQRIAVSIATAIDPHVLAAEVARVSSMPTENLGAYDSLLRGLAVLHTFRGGDFALAGTMFRRAIERDPHYARAHAHLAWWHILRVGEGRSAHLGEDARMATLHATQAVDLDPHDAGALAVAGHVQAFLRRNFDAALDLFDRGMRLNPNSVDVWAHSATTQAYLGHGEEALERLRRAVRLSPFDPRTYVFHTVSAIAAFTLGHDAEAAAWCARARRLNPSWRAAMRTMVAALALSGERVEAKALAEEFIGVEPDFRVGAFGDWYPLREPHLARLMHGMRLGGLPG